MVVNVITIYDCRHHGQCCMHYHRLHRIQHHNYHWPTAAKALFCYYEYESN